MRTSAIAVAACCAVAIAITIPLITKTKRETTNNNVVARSSATPSVTATNGIEKEPLSIAEPATITRTPHVKEIASLRNYLRQQQEPTVQKIMLISSADTVINFAHGKLYRK